MIEALAASGGAATVLWIVAASLVVAGVVVAIRGAVGAGVVLILLGLVVGPGGESVLA